MEFCMSYFDTWIFSALPCFQDKVTLSTIYEYYGIKKIKSLIKKYAAHELTFRKNSYSPISPYVRSNRVE